MELQKMHMPLMKPPVNKINPQLRLASLISQKNLLKC